MILRKWSHDWFKNHYRENIWGYIEKRFFPVVYKYMNEEQGLVLDAGCGFGNPYLEKLRLDNTVGMDIDPSVKDRNKIHREFIIGDLHYLNTKQRFNSIISVMTWEHLHSPRLVLNTFSNILKDHGILVIIAPQRWHYTAIIARLLPSYVQNICWRIIKHRKCMPYPVYYRLCSKNTLLGEASHQGFSIEYFASVEGPPIWFTKIPPLFVLACFWMSFVNKHKIFENIRGTFLAVLRKT